MEMLPRLVPLEDEEVSKELKKEFEKRKIKCLVGNKVELVEATNTGVRVKVSAEGKETGLEADQALVAIGFRPNSKGIGLEEAGVRINERGFVEINEKMQTNVPNIYAVGDLTGKLMLAHVGSAMGIVAAENIAGAETITLDYEMLPRATYCQPQIASFGLTEAQARERGYNFKIGRIPLPGQWQGPGFGRLRRLDKDHNGREIWRDSRRSHDRSRGHRAVARAYPGASYGVDAARDRAQCACAPVSFRSAGRSRPRGGRHAHTHLRGRTIEFPARQPCGPQHGYFLVGMLGLWE